MDFGKRYECISFFMADFNETCYDTVKIVEGIVYQIR